MEQATLKLFTIFTSGQIRNANDQKRFEGELNAMERNRGYLPTLLKLLSSGESAGITRQVRVFAAIRFKRCVYEGWKPAQRSQLNVSEEEKKVLRENVLHVVINAHPIVQRQLFEGLKIMAKADFPEKWGGLLQQIGKVIAGPNVTPPQLIGALEFLLILFRTYEFCHAGEKRKPLEVMVGNTFPTLLRIFQKMQGMPNNEHAHRVQKVIARLFYAGTHLAPPPFLFQSKENTEAWLGAFLKTMGSPLPNGAPSDPDRLAEWMPWKTRKWVMHILNKMLSRWTNPRKKDPQAWVQWGQWLFQKFAPPMLKMVLSYLDMLRNRKVVMPSRMKQVLLGFIDTSWRRKTMYQALGPHLLVIVREVCFPLLCFQPKDFRTWKEDPHEYLRANQDVMGEYYDPRKTTTNMLTELLRKKKKDLLQPVMDFVVSVLKRYAQAAPNQQTMEMAGQVYGALHVIGMNRRLLLKTKAFARGMESLLCAHVAPHMRSQFPFLRARATWTFSMFYDCPFQNTSQYLQMVQGTLNLLNDKELPVVVEATLSIRLILENDLAVETVGKVLPHLLKHFFTLINDLDSEELVGTLEALIFRFSDRIQPFAVAICKNLSSEFMRLVQEATADEESDNDEQVLAAGEILRCMVTILAAIRHSRELFPPVEHALLPVVRRVLQQDAIDFTEEGLKIMSFLTFYGETISPACWDVFPLLCQIFQTWGSDFLSELLPVFDNYISRNPDVFLRNNAAREGLMKVYDRAMKLPVVQEDQTAEACKLIEVLMQCCRGKIDPYIGGILALTLDRLKGPIEDVELRVILWIVIANVFHYNPLLAYQLCERKKCTGLVLQEWLKALDSFTRLYDQKMMSIALSSLLQVPIAQTPADAQKLFPSLCRANLKVLWRMNQTMAKQAAKREARKQAIANAGSSAFADANGMQSDSESDPEELDTDERGSLDEFSIEDLQAITAETTAAYRAALGELSSSDDEEWYDPDEDDQDRGDELMSPVDRMNELQFFVENFQAFSKRDAAPFNQLMQMLSQEEKNTLNKFAQEVQKQKAEEAQKASKSI